MAKDKSNKVRVRFIRTHYPAGSVKPYTIGQEVELDADEAKGLATYDILEILAAPEAPGSTGRLPTDAVVTRIEQLMPAADQGEEAAIAELAHLRDQELAGGKPRKRVVAALRSAKVAGLPDAED